MTSTLRIKPLKQWYCDMCGELILSPSDGMVTARFDGKLYHNFRIVHCGRCTGRRFNCSCSLKEFLGRDGLSFALSKLSPGILLTQRGDRGGIEVANIDAYVDLIRRLQTPHYEGARRNWRDDPDLTAVLHDANEHTPYTQRVLRRDAERVNRRDN